MSAGGWAMLAVLAVSFLSLAFVIGTLIRSITVERTPGRPIAKEFGLGLSLMVLFFVTWVGHAVSEWQEFTDEQLAQGTTPAVGDFVSRFTASTLENWQSEFLQLFAFVVLAALYVHKGSAESKDGDERMEASLRRIEERLGTLPGGVPPGDSLPDPSVTGRGAAHLN